MEYYLNGKRISENEYLEIKKENPDIEEIFDTGCDYCGNEFTYIELVKN